MASPIRPEWSFSVGLVAVVCAALMLAIGAGLGWHQAQMGFAVEPPAGRQLIDPVAADLSAQQSMAASANMMLWATAAQVLVGAIGLFLIWGTFRQAADGADLARKTYAAERRTFMEVSLDNVLEVSFGPAGTSVNYTLSAKNVGNFPALDVDLYGAIYQSRNALPTEATLQKFIAGRLVEPVFTTTVLPQAKFSLTYTSQATSDDALNKIDGVFARGLSDDAKRRLSLTALFMVSYKGVGSPDTYYTAKAGYLKREDGKPFDPADGFGSGRVVFGPAEHMYRMS